MYAKLAADTLYDDHESADFLVSHKDNKGHQQQHDMIYNRRPEDDIYLLLVRRPKVLHGRKAPADM